MQSLVECLRLIRWGVVGPGRAAARFAEGLQAVPGASLSAVWGRDPERASAYAAAHGVTEVCGTLSQLLSTSVDAVYISTHPDTHAEICIQALAAGKHVLCEKPAALNVRTLGLVLAAVCSFDRLFK